MPDGIKTTKTSKILLVIVKIGMLFGGAWIVFSLFSEISMNILQRPELIHNFTPQFIVDISLEFVFQISLAVMLIISAILGVGKFLNFLWAFTGGVYIINVLYSIYKYLWYSVNFFRNYNFSFDGIVKIIEFLLYFSFVCSLVLICLYCGNIIPRKNKKIVVVFSLLGIVYLFYILVVSLFGGEESAYVDVVKNSLNFITYISLYSYGFITEQTPKNNLINDEKTDVETEEETLNLDKITVLIDEISEEDSSEKDLAVSEFEELNDIPVEMLGNIDDDDLSSNNKGKTIVDADLPLMGEGFSFEKDESIINDILKEIYSGNESYDTNDRDLLFDDASTNSVEGSTDFDLSEGIKLVEFTLLSDEDE